MSMNYSQNNMHNYKYYNMRESSNRFVQPQHHTECGTAQVSLNKLIKLEEQLTMRYCDVIHYMVHHRSESNSFLKFSDI